MDFPGLAFTQAMGPGQAGGRQTADDPARGTMHGRGVGPVLHQAGVQNTRFIMIIMTVRNNTVMTPPARMKSGTR